MLPPILPSYKSTNPTKQTRHSIQNKHFLQLVSPETSLGGLGRLTITSLASQLCSFITWFRRIAVCILKTFCDVRLFEGEDG